MSEDRISRRSLLTTGAAGLLAAACSTTTMKRVARSPSKFDTEQFIAEVRQAVSQGQGAVADVIARAVSDPTSVLRELGEPKVDGGAELYVDDTVTIAVITWKPHSFTQAHDHRMWGSVGVYLGREDNFIWRRSGNRIEPISAATVGPREVYSMTTDMIHSVVNPTDAWMAALHVYGGNLLTTERSRWDPLTLREERIEGST